MEDKELTSRLAEMTQDQQPQEQPEVQPQEETQEQQELAAPEETAPQQPQQTQEQKESGHFKKLRESYEREKREKEQLYDIVYKMQQMQSATPAAKKTEEPELDDDDYVPRNYVDKRLRETQEQLAQYQQALYEQAVSNQLRSQYQDFSQVLSSENISKLREEHPEIAASLASNPDIASKAQATYKIIKKLGIATPDRFEEDRQRVQTNTQKPRPAVTSPLSYAHDYEYKRMSDDEMRRNREELESAIKG